MFPFIKGAAALAAVAGLAACQTTPPTNNDLIAARAAVSQAAGNPYVARAGAVELQRAEQAMRRAEAAWADNRDTDEATHLAYLATQRAAIASAVGAQAQADERAQQAGAERERARLEARTREAEAATRQAQAAQGQAMQSQQQAAQSQQQAAAAEQLLAQQAERAAALERDLQALEGKATQRGMVLTLGDVLFATGRAELQPGAQRSVQQLAQVLQQYPERRILIEGFTDSVGSQAANLALSNRRADAFRNALLSAGVPPDRIDVRAHGEAFPVADNATPAGRQQNRRVEVLFSDPQGRFATR